MEVICGDCCDPAPGHGQNDDHDDDDGNDGD